MVSPQLPAKYHQLPALLIGQIDTLVKRILYRFYLFKTEIARGRVVSETTNALYSSISVFRVDSSIWKWRSDAGDIRVDATDAQGRCQVWINRVFEAAY